MMNEEYHKPFIKSLIIVAFVTVVAVISSHYIIDYYANQLLLPPKTIEYSIQKD